MIDAHALPGRQLQRAASSASAQRGLVVLAALTAGVLVSRPGLHPFLAMALLAPAVAFLPRWVLLGVILPVRFFYHEPVLPEMSSELTTTDMLVLAVATRFALEALLHRRIAFSRNALLLAAFVAWAWLATIQAGVTITPLLRITAYAVMAIAAAMDAGPARPVHGMVTGYAFVRLATAVPFIATGLAAAQEEIGDPHQLGFLLLAGATPFLAGEFGRGATRWVPAALLLIGAMATFRRGVWFAVIVVVVLTIAPRVSVRRLVGITIGLALLGWAAFGPVSRMFDLDQNSLDYRRSTIGAGLQIAGRSPVIGAGWAGFVGETPAGVTVEIDAALPSAEGRAPASLPVYVLASVGIPGFVLFCLYLYSTLARLHLLSRTAFLIAGGFLALSLFGSTFVADSNVTILFFVIVATEAAVLTAGERHDTTAAPVRAAVPAGPS